MCWPEGIYLAFSLYAWVKEGEEEGVVKCKKYVYIENLCMESRDMRKKFF